MIVGVACSALVGVGLAECSIAIVEFGYEQAAEFVEDLRLLLHPPGVR